MPFFNMLSNSFTKAFEGEVELFLPGYVIACDLADTKRRNLNLGFEHVDNDILEFDTLLRRNLQGDAIISRVFGDKWLAFVKDEPRAALNELRAQYHNELLTSVGWRCKAISPGGAVKSVEHRSETAIVRAFRCVYAHISSAEGLNSIIEYILGNVSLCPVDTVCSEEFLSETQSKASLRWECVNHSLVGDLECPFCGGQEFEWTDGAEDAASGSCKSCEAECDFSMW